MEYKIVSLNERFDLFRDQDLICEEAWPEFMMHDPLTNDHWMTYIEAYKDHQLLMMDGDEILAVINTIPFTGDLNNLPDEGWDGGFARGIADIQEGRKSNLLMGVQIVINKKYQGRGLSQPGVEEMATLAKNKGYEALVIPVRPSEKHKFPLIPMEEYIKWEKEPGLPYDGWLRVHIRAGGEIIKVCPRAMYIPGTLNEWREWTGIEIRGSGSYIVPYALNPVVVDAENNRAVYIEPNVWVLHRLR